MNFLYMICMMFNQVDTPESIAFQTFSRNADFHCGYYLQINIADRYHDRLRQNKNLMPFLKDKYTEPGMAITMR